MKICPICRKRFHNDKHHQKYCSDLCAITARRLRGKERYIKPARRTSGLDMMDPEDLLHYGTIQKERILKGES